jgi:16S rRNA (uracil1498-N3)-methyltransferase
MLWLAEKSAELNIASWRPVLWQRSRSVTPRGDGPTFRNKVRARMISALLQSRSAWLPEIFPEATPDRAIAASPAGSRLVLEASGSPINAMPSEAPVVVAIGPEGGFEEQELLELAEAGFRAVSIGRSVLRFETAAVAGIAVARALLDSASFKDAKSS